MCLSKKVIATVACMCVDQEFTRAISFDLSSSSIQMFHYVKPLNGG
jgi:hypothetical protein